MSLGAEKLDTIELVREDPLPLPVEADNGFRLKAGTGQDDADMRRLGRRQQLNRSFHALSILGLTSMIVDTWVGLLSYVSMHNAVVLEEDAEYSETDRSCNFSFINGGRGGSIWAYLVVWIANIAVTASMAEMASMAPTSAGQYHWVSEFAPASVQRGLSYITGWIAALSWQSFLATPIFFAAELILTLASMTYVEYQPRPWHATLLTMAIAIFVTCFNIFGSRRLPMIEGVVLVAFILGFFAVVIPLWTIAPMVPARVAFTTFDNYGGWASVGAAAYIGQITAAGCLVCTDSGAHMAEEVRDASRTVPRMMMTTIIINGLMGFAMIITLAFVVQDVKSQMVDATVAFPFIPVFAAAVGSTGGAIGMTVPIIVLAICNSVNAMATASRQAWAFSRDNGLPFPRWFTKVTVVDRTPIPVNAMLASLSICFVIALLNLGGSEVFDSVYGLGAGAACLTYLLSIGSVLWRRAFGAPLPHARWSMGRFGVVANIIAVLYLSQFFVVSFFPVFRKVTAQSMNWGIAMFGGITLICVANYFINGRRTFEGPVMHLEKNLY